MNISTVTGISPDERSYLPTDQLPNGRVGLEVELEGFSNGLTFPSSFWDVVEEPSIRDHGWEFIFSAPTNGLDILTAINQLGSFLEGMDEVYVSKRAGIHCHLDVRQWTTEMIWRLHIIYLIVEPMIYKTLALGRDKSQYCIKFSEVHWDSSRLDQFRNTSAQHVMAGIQQCAKYLAINSLSVSQKGSVEFRLFNTSKDPAVMLKIIKLVLKLGEVATDLSINLTDRDLHHIKGIFSIPDDLYREGCSNADYFSHMNELIESHNHLGRRRQYKKGSTILKLFAGQNGLTFGGDDDT